MKNEHKKLKMKLFDELLNEKCKKNTHENHRITRNLGKKFEIKLHKYVNDFWIYFSLFDLS